MQSVMITWFVFYLIRKIALFNGIDIEKCLRILKLSRFG